MILDQKRVDPELLGSLTLAFMGDAIIETYVREAVIAASKAKIHRLHEQTISYVSAKAQSAFLHELTAAGFLTDQEQDIVRKGRNVKPHTVPKNTDVQTYNFSTGFEALIGYLHFAGRKKRIDEIMKRMFALHPAEGRRNQ
ncbi:Mini-ribonuclease 3 [Sporolactobacillus vineae]|uniref:Mini-ribonuclease 3 n=1 Tax=Sporolactobacillus vineae TaxID=444463 RepID=UPI000289F7A0|nr:ribonuclease III domain-containing protein [Sporolactobacillus vineae]